MKKYGLFFLKTISWITLRIPVRLLHVMSYWVGFLWFDVFGFRKKIILQNLDIAFPEWSAAKKKAVGRESVYNLGYNFSELFLIPGMTPKWAEKNIVFDGWEHVENALAQKKGLFFLTLHLGNGDLATKATSLRGLEVNMITKRFKTPWFDQLWFTLRGGKGIRYIDSHSPTNAFEILKALKRNAAVVFVLDQFMGKPFGIETQFFGRTTGTAYGLAVFCQKSKAPVIPVYTYHAHDGKLHVVFEPSLDTQKFIVEDKDRAIKDLTQSFNDKLEEIVRRHPEQWMWVHRRWKDF